MVCPNSTNHLNQLKARKKKIITQTIHYLQKHTNNKTTQTHTCDLQMTSQILKLKMTVLTLLDKMNRYQQRKDEKNNPICVAKSHHSPIFVHYVYCR